MWLNEKNTFINKKNEKQDEKKAKPNLKKKRIQPETREKDRRTGYFLAEERIRLMKKGKKEIKGSPVYRDLEKRKRSAGKNVLIENPEQPYKKKQKTKKTFLTRRT